MSAGPGVARGRLYTLLAVRGVEGLPVLFGAALALSSLLLFWVQPMFTKMALPLYGGSPSVWTTASMFFQMVLLLGYLYAHLLTNKLQLKYQVLVHVALLCCVFAALPPRLHDGWTDLAESAPVFSLLGLLLSGLALPLIVISSTAPLLQRWFSLMRGAAAKDPYFLYVASNAGGLVALAGYPVLLEPLLGSRQQSTIWAWGYALLAVLITVCAASVIVFRDSSAAAAAPVAPVAPVAWRTRGLWLLLAFAPSSLMLGVVQHITTEIAAVPLLWLAPLTLYVLSFIIAFARRSAPTPGWSVTAQPLLTILVALVWGLNYHASILALHLLAFFVSALMCHTVLARQRPDVSQLTEYYLLIAAGGALGGIFNAIAPLVFNSIVEYPLAIALACMLRPAPVRENAGLRWTDIALPALLAIALAIVVALDLQPLTSGNAGGIIYFVAVGVALYVFSRRPIRFGLGVAAVLLATPALQETDHMLERHRDFYGVHTVLKDKTDTFYVLMHGVTIHGAEYIDPALRLAKPTYYSGESPIGQYFHAVGQSGAVRHAAAIGIGLGTVACFRDPSRQWTLYEIDPDVVRIAHDTRYFHFVSDCAPGAVTVIGDGRLSLARAPDGYFDLIVVDTFNSDAIPLHMITREALALYLKKLTPNGVIMVHISNRFLDLGPELAALAADAGVIALKAGPPPNMPDKGLAAMPSLWVAMTRDTRLPAIMATYKNWVPALAEPGTRPWTDDYSNVMSTLKLEP